MKKKLMLIVVLFFSLIASATVVITSNIISYCMICGTKYEIGDITYSNGSYIYKCKKCGLENEMNEEEFNEAVRKLEKTLADQTKSEADVK